MTVLACLAAMAVLLAVVRRNSPPVDRFFRRLAGEAGEPGDTRPSPATSVAPAFVAALLLTATALAWLEWTRPYFFVQDDILVGELPGILYACRSAAQGVWPDYNPWILMGAPTMLWYPPLYLSHALAVHALGDEMATIEVFAFLHLLGGYAATFWASRRIGVSPVTAALVAMAFVLSGSFLVMGRSWHSFLTPAVWMPLLVGQIVRLVQGRGGLGWSVATGLSIGLFYLVGFPQLWMLSLLMLGVAVSWLVATGGLRPRDLAWVAAALLIGLGLAAPLLSEHLDAGSDIQRATAWGHGIGAGLVAMFLPYPLAEAPHPDAFGSTDIEVMGHLYYFGTTFAVLAVLALLGPLTRRPDRAMLARNAWLACAMAALALALGHECTLGPSAQDAPPRVPLAALPGTLAILLLLAWLWMRRAGRDRAARVTGWLAAVAGGVVALLAPAPWTVLSWLPVVKNVCNHPVRMMPLVVLFTVLAGGLALERLLAGSPRRRAWEGIVAAITVFLLGWNVAMAHAAFYTYAFRPYPELPPQLSSLLHPGNPTPDSRMVPWARTRSIDPSFGLSLAHNLPDVYEILSFDGYDPLIESKMAFRTVQRRIAEDPIAAFRAYGVRWHLLHRNVYDYVPSPNAADSPFVQTLENNVRRGPSLGALLDAHLRVALRLPEMIVFELPDVDPLAFPDVLPRRALPLQPRADGLDVDVSGLPAGGAVVVNFLWYPQLEARADDVPIDLLRDEFWYRMVAQVPPGTRTLTIRRAANTAGTCTGLALVAMGLGVGLLAGRRQRGVSRS